MQRRGKQEVIFSGASINGSELDYDPTHWTSLPNVANLNCYDYSMGNDNVMQKRSSQPVPWPEDGEYSCPVVEAGVLLQNPTTAIWEFERPCPIGMRKIALVVDATGPKSDFHFYRQDDDGMWSHKPGSLDPRRVDASGNRIMAPHMSDRDFKAYDYAEFCNYYCVDVNPGDD